MLRQITIGLVLALGCLCGSLNADGQSKNPEFSTEWIVKTAEGLDAILLLGAASGDLLQANHYAEDIRWVRENMSPQGLESLERIDDTLRVKLGMLTGPKLVDLFSAGDFDTLDQVIESAADPVGKLKAGMMESPRWDPKGFENAVRLMPSVHRVLVEMRDAGFPEWYESRFREQLDLSVVANLDAVRPYDIIPEQERLLGRELDPRVEILILNFNMPYGIRITGQRFIAHHHWDADTQLRVATHELFHSPYDSDDATLLELLEPLRSDPWVTSIVENHDPQYGYNSFEGLVDEDSTQALDQLVSERLGFARNPEKRWQHVDGGMHMLAAAIYQAMKVSGFAESGGNYAEWLADALRGGLLTPQSVKTLAAEVVGDDAVSAWMRPRPATH